MKKEKNDAFISSEFVYRILLFLDRSYPGLSPEELKKLRMSILRRNALFKKNMIRIVVPYFFVGAICFLFISVLSIGLFYFMIISYRVRPQDMIAFPTISGVFFIGFVAVLRAYLSLKQELKNTIFEEFENS